MRQKISSASALSSGAKSCEFDTSAKNSLDTGVGCTKSAREEPVGTCQMLTEYSWRLTELVSNNNPCKQSLYTDAPDVLISCSFMVSKFQILQTVGKARGV